MPQINVTEIDQSVVTRVVKDDRVKILVPVTSSFGPAFDATNISANTFTDVTAYDRVYGYTPAQFNPIASDQSRTYARELIKKGAAVSVVRVNGGMVSEFAIGPYDSEGVYTARTTPSYDTVPVSVLHSDEFAGDCEAKATITTTASTFTYDSTNHKATATLTAIKEMLPGSLRIVATSGADSATVSLSITDSGVATFDDTTGNKMGTLISTSTGKSCGTVNYTTGAVEITGLDANINADGTIDAKAVKSGINYVKYTFAPQIAYIKAKYPGSFGNDLLVSITPVNTSRLAESFQYANISVYYIDRTVVYDENNNIDYSRSFVKSTTLLETKMITTNPNDPRYFEDVEFDFIQIGAEQGARDQFTLVWSNINENPSSGTTLYPGFPAIPFRVSYGGSEYTYGYNYDAFATKEFGTDYMYSPTTLTALKQGFKGYIIGTNWTQPILNGYITDVYGAQGIFKTIMTNLATLYQNFKDPYIYDFDFITSGGFVYEEYTTATTGSGADEVVTYSRTLPTGANNVVYTKVTPIHESMKDLVTSRKDCIALIDVPDEYDPKKIIEYSRLINTSYATMHFPWCYVSSPYIAGALIKMAPSYIFMYTFLQNLENNIDSQKWFPPAGVTRATARVVKKPDFEIGSVLLDDWQNNNTSRVNPVMKLKQYGYVIYGQYTCLEAIDQFTHSALESLNVRLVANTVKKKIFDVCLNLAFDPNGEKLWLKFFAQMDEFLRFMKYNEGVYDYKIVMDESTVTTDDINHLRCPGKVYIAPTRTAEFFDIDFIITEAGAVFTD